MAATDSTRGMEDTAPTRNAAVQTNAVSRSEAASDAANEVLFSVLDQVARGGGSPGEAAAAREHIAQMRAEGKVVFPEDLPGEDRASIVAAARQTGGPVQPARVEAVDAGTVAQETVYGLLADAGALTRTPTPGEAAAPTEAQEAPGDAAPIKLDFTAPPDLADELDIDDYVPPEIYDPKPPPPPPDDDEDVVDEYLDPAVAEERQKRIAAERRAAHFEGLRLKEGQKAWVAEAKQHLGPLVTEAQLQQIQATSRRDFWRQAKQVHAQNVELVRPLVSNILAGASAEAERVKADARAEAQKAWGKPNLAGANTAQEVASRREQRIEDARRGRSFHDVVKAMIT